MSKCERYSAEQQQVIDLPVDARVIVDAAAGTGKTHVLAGRVARLVELEGLSAGDEILVLSFSRAAVSELRRRVALQGGDARYVGAATFDAFATQLLDSEEPEGVWTAGSYDDRVRAAAELLRRPATPQLLGMVRHILVDEIQDLVGPRAALVAALLDRVDAGFTLFGDPAQAIYGHRVGVGADALTNAQFYEWIADRFDGRLSRRSLTQDFRGGTSQSDAIAEVGRRLRMPQPDHVAISSQIRTIVLKTPITTLGAARRLLLRPGDGTSAVLCRTNGEALRISNELSERLIGHRYQRRGEEKAAAGWLGKVVFGVPGTKTTRSELAPRLDSVAEQHESTADELFGVLRRLDPARGEGVDLQRVADRVRGGAFPEELNEVVAAPVVVSTVHRAKGLEFDRVFLTDPGNRDVSDLGEDNRVFYVALSRARHEMFHLPQPDTTGLGVDRASGRWVRRGFGAHRRRVFELEVLGSDVDFVHPPGTWLFDDDASAVQRYLVDVVAPGDPVELVLTSPPSDDEVAGFRVQHRDRSIGVTSGAFGALLRRVLGANSKPPQSIAGLRVEMVDTVAGDAIIARRHGLGAHGLWNRARVFGLGTLVFDGARGGRE